MLDVDDIRLFLEISEQDYCEDDLMRYIEYFTREVAAKIKVPINDKLLGNPLFDQAILSGIACHISKLNPQLFTSPTKEEVGDTNLERADAYMSNMPNWCNAYDEAIQDLISSYDDISNIKTFRRKGLSRHPRWCRYVF